MKSSAKFIFAQLIILIALGLSLPANLQATVYTLDLALSGQFEVPANPSTASGVLVGTYDDATNVLSFTLMFNGLLGQATAAHFHGPAAAGTNGPVVIGFAGFPAGVTSGTYSNTYTLTPPQESELLCGMWYVNIHTTLFPGGELRSQLKEGVTSGNTSTLELGMTGQNEVPPNGLSGTGTLVGTFNHTTDVLSFTILFNGLTGLTTAAHFHGPAAPGANGPVQVTLIGFPTVVTSGMYSNSIVLTPAQKVQFLAGLWYVNIHTTLYPAGEVRGQLKEGTLTGICPATIPTLSQWGLIILGCVLLGFGTFYIARMRG